MWHKTVVLICDIHKSVVNACITLQLQLLSQQEWRTYISAPLSAIASIQLLSPSVDLLTIGDEYSQCTENSVIELSYLHRKMSHFINEKQIPCQHCLKCDLENSFSY